MEMLAEIVRERAESAIQQASMRVTDLNVVGGIRGGG